MRLALASLLILAILPAAVAHAADAKAMAEARALYDKAIAHYDLAEYDLAIGEFKQAYELTRAPALLFNIAQAYRLAKQYEQALHFYETFLKLAPNAPNRADAEAQVENMKEAMKESRPIAPTPTPPVVTPPPTPAPAPTPAPVVTPPSESRGARFLHSRRGKATIAIAAVGAAALIAAAGTGGEALAIKSRYDSGCAAGPCDGNLYSRGRGYAVATDVLLSVGVVAAVTAVIVGVTHRRERPVTLGMAF